MRYGIIAFLMVCSVFLAVPSIAARLAGVIARRTTRISQFFERRRAARKLPKATVRERDN